MEPVGRLSHLEAAQSPVETQGKVHYSTFLSLSLFPFLSAFFLSFRLVGCFLFVFFFFLIFKLDNQLGAPGFGENGGNEVLLPLCSSLLGTSDIPAKMCAFHQNQGTKQSLVKNSQSQSTCGRYLSL